MLALNGIYDGKSVKLTEHFPQKGKFKVVVTFIEELESTDSLLRDFSASTVGLDFWNDSKEDLYQDFLSTSESKK